MLFSPFSHPVLVNLESNNAYSGQGIRGRSRYPDHPQEPYRGDPKKAGTKRLFSNRETILAETSEDHGENYDVEEAENHSGKRYRPSDWPLTSTARTESPHSVPRTRNTTKSPCFRRARSSEVRRSKFIEGSMNDRVSHRPPTTYIGDEDLQERYEREENGEISSRKMAHPKKLMHHPNASMAGSSTDGSEVSRHSSIFRFGKALAASFNPSNWRIWSKTQQQEEETAQQKIWRERREKAESMYQELKKSGHFRDSGFGQPLFRQQEDKKKVPQKHDYGVEFGEQRTDSRLSVATSMEEKRMGRIFLEPPELPTGGESPTSNGRNSAPPRGFHFKKPSLSNIRNSRGSDNGSNAPSSGDDHHIRRVPSRKDLQKQQRLIKRVSDLENKLQAARRQLAEALNEPVPSQPYPRGGRSRFVPGALSTLPSERLLSGYVSPGAGLSDDDGEGLSQIGQAVTVDYKEENRPFMSGAKVNSELSELEEPSLRDAEPVLQLDKPLSREPETPLYDRVMQSVETEEKLVKVEPAVNAMKPRHMQAADGDTNAQVSRQSSELSESGISESNYEEEEPAKKKTSPKLAKQPSKSKKRKSIFDDSSPYRPGADTESEVSEIKKRSPLKKKTGALPQASKLQKTVKDTNISLDKQTPSIPNTKEPSPPRKAAAAHRASGKKPTTPSSATVPSSRIPKSKIPFKGRQSASPPPSGPFNGLEYMKPSFQSGKHSIAGAMEAAYGAVPFAEGGDIPPVPEIPKAVRLANVDVVSTAPAPAPAAKAAGQLKHAANNARGKQVKAQRPQGETKMGEKNGEENKEEEFQWPDDVF